jgi:hypothetical protein
VLLMPTVRGLRSYWMAWPFDALAVLAVIALLWRGLPRKEFVLCAIVVAICVYLGWRFYHHSIRYPQQATVIQIGDLSK